MARKFIYYLKGFSRTIVITDKDETTSMEETISKISKLMSGHRVSKFETDNDILIVRPSDIIGVHIAKDFSESSYMDEQEDDDNIRLQSIVPEIDLGELDSEDDMLEDQNIKTESIDEQDGEEDTKDDSAPEPVEP